MAESSDTPLEAVSGTNNHSVRAESTTKNGEPPTSNSDDMFPESVSSSSVKDELFLGTLKKDDSGIDLEKSPTASAKETLSDGEAEDCAKDSLNNNSSLLQNDSQNDSAVQSCFVTGSEESPDLSVDTESEKSSPTHSADVETSDVGEVDGPAVGDAGVDSPHISDSPANFRNDVCDSVELASESTDTDRRKRSHLDSSVDDDDDDDDDDNAGVEEVVKSDDDDDDMDIGCGKTPQHKWHALFDLRNREIGYANTTPPSYFREKVQGSLQMVQRLKLQYGMEYHDGCVNALHFNRIGTLLASGSDDLHIVLWNWIRNRPALAYESGHRSNVFQAKFMPFSGDCHVVSCARDGQVRLAELSLTGICKTTKKLAQHRGAAHKLALEYDSPHLFLSCGEDAVTYEIDLREEKPNKLCTTKENDRKVALYSIHSNPSNSFEYCVGGRDHYIRIYDKRKIAEDTDGGVVKKYCPHHLIGNETKANVTCACYNYNGTGVLGTYNDEDIYMFSNEHSDGANYIHRYQGHRNNQTVKGVNFYGPRSEFVVSGSDCGHVYMWDTETEKIVQFLEADNGGVINVLEPHPFAPILATSGLDHDVKIFAPTEMEPTDLKGLKKAARRNKKDREQERLQEPDMIDGQMLWFIMHHFRRSARRRRRDEGEDVSSSSESESFNSDSDTDPEQPQTE
ncbi:DDB1- and CUL4-associated factor 8-like isoform X2 [Gigantopelta aegis]|uniref:DDB1- and CUL4-associated factor 8-like isoform X2 n=1 Tax=Gigantopelta aegis TaxID=1735272 RepID=UPI001B889F70|nr:DDB1- and CUL4-associated factor 8-like isoform X2 [Gigantopelta aegis]